MSADTEDAARDIVHKIQVNPPPGWFVFGDHVDDPRPMEFWGEEFSKDGMPLWERPLP